jgi:hypothetical protein
MGDSRSEDPPEGGWTLRRVVDGIQFLGSGRRSSQPGATTRRSVSTPAQQHPNVSLSIQRSSDHSSGVRPDPDAPRAETLGEHWTPLLGDVFHPNVVSRRGHYNNASYSVVGSVSGSIQQQVQHLEAWTPAV